MTMSEISNFENGRLVGALAIGQNIINYVYGTRPDVKVTTIHGLNSYAVKFAYRYCLLG